MVSENDYLIDMLFDNGYDSGVSTGFSELDKVAGGLKKGQLIMLAGSPGMGKSILALSILVSVAKSGTHVSYFDLENGKEESFKRILKSWFELPQDFFKGEKNKKRTDKMLEEVDNNLEYWGFEELIPFQYQKYGWTVIEGLIRVGGRSSDFKPRVVVIDPLQALERSTDPGKALLEQGEIVRHFKELAQRLNITIIICHHLRKTQYYGGDYITSLDNLGEVRYRVPTVEDLKGSSKIGDFAQGVWGIVRAISSGDREERSRTLLRVSKNRNGLTGDIKLFFDECNLVFKDKPIVSGDPLGSFFGQST